MSLVPSVVPASPVRRPGGGAPVRVAASGEADTVDVGELMRTVGRGWRTVLIGGLVGALVALAVIYFVPPRYRTVSTLLVRNAGDPTSSLLSRIGMSTDALGASGGGGGGGALGNVMKSPLETEVKLVGSRDVLGQVVDSLGLQAQVLSPRGTPIAQLVAPARYAGSFRKREITFARAADGRYRARGDGVDATLAPGRPAPILPGGGTVTLAAAGALPPTFTIEFDDREDAITALDDRLKVSKLAGELVEIVYSGRDSVTAAQVPNAIAAVYLARRRTVDRGINERRYEFLAVQSDSVARELAGAEGALRAQQEASGVFDPELTGRTAADALRAVEEQLVTVDAERQVIGDVVGQVERGEISPRRLAAFPSFLRSPAVNTLFTQVTQLETERRQRLETRTERDPSIITLGANIANLEGQLLPLGRTYAGSLDRQAAELRRERDLIQGRLGALPREAQGAVRRQRDVKMLSQTEGALQAQLIETRLAAISEGGQVRQVDAALPPKKIYFPRPRPTVAVGIVVGLLGGVLWAVFAGVLSTRVTSVDDAERATGLPAFAARAGSMLMPGAGAWTGTVVLVPVGASAAAVSGFAQQLAAQVQDRQRRAEFVDVAGVSPDAAGALAAARAVQAAEARAEFVAVAGAVLEDRRMTAVLDVSRPVLLCAAARRTRRPELAHAADLLARAEIPCAGVLLADGPMRTFGASPGAVPHGADARAADGDRRADPAPVLASTT